MFIGNNWSNINYRHLVDQLITNAYETVSNEYCDNDNVEKFMKIGDRLKFEEVMELREFDNCKNSPEWNVFVAETQCLHENGRTG